MLGIIKGFSPKKQRAAAFTDLGFTIFDIQDGEVSIGDEVIGNLNSHGAQNLINQTTGQKLAVYIEAIQATQSAAQSMLYN